jgi:Fur family ferric uptake transcriptional regulator
VYGVLHTFTGVGLVRRTEPSGPACTSSAPTTTPTLSAIADVDCTSGDIPCLTTVDDSGYEIGEAEVISRGRCSKCISATSVSSGELEQKPSV